MKIISERAISAPEAKVILEKKNPEGMSYEQKIALDFLNKQIKLDAASAAKIREELEPMKLPAEQVALIINNLPQRDEEIKTILGKTNLSADDNKRIVDAVKKYV